MSAEGDKKGMRRWWNTDLHTHSPASRDTHMDNVTENTWLMAFMQVEIDSIAITDHNTGEWIDRARNAYTRMEQESFPGFRPLTIFPGVEITTREGIHLIAILDPGYGTDIIESFLDEIGSPRVMRGEASCYADAGIRDIISGIERIKGIAIPAHIDRKRGRGIFCLDQDCLSGLVQSGQIYVVESSGLCSEWMPPYQNNPHGWAVIAGSDAHTLNPEDPISRLPGSVITRMYMKEITIDSLRLVFQSGNEWICRIFTIDNP